MPDLGGEAQSRSPGSPSSGGQTLSVFAERWLKREATNYTG